MRTKEITSSEIIQNGCLLTLNAAKGLIGKKVAITSPEASGNISTVRIFTINGFISEWDTAALVIEGFEKYGSRQKYWESYMDKKRIEELKNTLLIETEFNLVEAYWGNVGIRCHKDIPLFSEPMFTGSDIDREVYYIVLDDEN